MKLFLCCLNSLAFILVSPLVPAAVTGQPYASYFFPNTVPSGATGQSLASWSPTTDPDAPFNVSSVPLATRYTPTQVNSVVGSTSAGVMSLAAFPTTNGNPSQGSQTMAYYAPTYWQYVNQLVFWGGSATTGIILAPNGPIIDAGHRNGVPVLGVIYLPPAAYGGQFSWTSDLLQTPDGGVTFPIADKLILLTQYYGFDGWFINAETAGGNSSTAVLMSEFIQYIHTKAPTMLISWYDAMIDTGAIDWQEALDSNNQMFLQTGGGTDVANSLFIDFSWSTSSINSSVSLANSLGISPFNLFAGIELENDNWAGDGTGGYLSSQNWSSLFKVSGGKNTPKVSFGLYRPEWTFTNATGANDLALMQDFFSMESLFWVGALSDPSNTSLYVSGSGSTGWKGIANYIQARSVTSGSSFITNFNTGIGQMYAINGQTLATGEWNNLSLQDIMPTWRWLITSSDGSTTKLAPAFDFTNAYYGGASLKVTGSMTAYNDLSLYSTTLVLSGSSNLRIAFNNGQVGAATMLQVTLTFSDSTIAYLAAGNTVTAGWNTVTFPLSSYSGKTIAGIGLRFGNGGAISNYTMSVGQIAIFNGTPAAPAPPTGVTINQLNLLTTTTASARLRWTHSTSWPSGVYYYNIYQINADNSRTWLGATPNNAYFIPSVAIPMNIVVEAIGPDFGSVSTDASLVYPPPLTNVYWFGNGVTQGGAGTWTSTGLNWASAAAGPVVSGLNPDATMLAIFGGSSGAVAVGTPVTTGGMEFNADGYTVSGDAITLGGDIPSISVEGGETATISAVLSGTSGLAVTGSGTLNLTGTNNYTGATSVTGTLQVNTSSLPGGTIVTGSGTLNVTNTGTGVLTLTNSNSLSSFTGSFCILSGTVIAHCGSDNAWAAFVGVWSADNTTSAFLLGANGDVMTGRPMFGSGGNNCSYIIGGANTSGTVTYSNWINVFDNSSSGPICFSAASGGQVNILNVIGGSAAELVKIGAGVLRIGSVGANSADHAWSGGTVVRSGTLLVAAEDYGNIANGTALPYNSIISNGAGGGLGESSFSTAVQLGDSETQPTDNISLLTSGISNVGHNIQVNNVGASTTIGGYDSTTPYFYGNIALQEGVTLYANEIAYFTGAITGNGAVTTQAGSSSGKVVLANAGNTYDGGTIVASGILQQGVANALPAGGNLTVNSGATFDLNGLSCNIQGLSGTGTILSSSGGSVSLTTNSGAFSGAIQGAVSLVKIGSGTLTLSASNSFGASAIVNAGCITALGTAISSQSLVIGSGATLEYNVLSGTVNQLKTTISGTGGTLQKTGAGTLIFGTGSGQTIDWNLGPGSLIDIEGGYVVGGTYANDNWADNYSSLNVAVGTTFSGVEANVQVDALTGAGTILSGYPGAGYQCFTFGAANGSGTFSGVLADASSPGNFVKAGSGTQVLTETSTYTGSTTVKGGVLEVDGVLAATNGLSVLSGGTITGCGAVQTVTINSGATLSPGRSGITGTLSTGALTLNSGAACNFLLGTASDQVAVNGNLNLSGTINLVDSGSAIGGSYTLFTYSGTLSGTPALVVPSGFVGALDTSNPGLVKVDLVANAFVTWERSQFSSAQLANPLISGQLATPAGDGLPNLLKYALGLDPLTPSTAQTTLTNTGGTWEFTFLRPANRADIIYIVEVSPDLSTGSWTTSGVTLTEMVAGDSETWQANCAQKGAGRLFFRLRVTKP